MKICDRCLVKGCSEQRRMMCIISEFGIEMEENANDNEARIIKAVLFALKDKVRACYDYGQEH